MYSLCQTLPANGALGWVPAGLCLHVSVPLTDFLRALNCVLPSDGVRLGCGPKYGQSAGSWPLCTCSYELRGNWRLTQGPGGSPCREGPPERGHFPGDFHRALTLTFKWYHFLKLKAEKAEGRAHLLLRPFRSLPCGLSSECQCCFGDRGRNVSVVKAEKESSTPLFNFGRQRDASP